MDNEKILTEEKSDEITISLSDIFYTLKNRIWIIILVTLVAFGIGIWRTYTVEPDYTSTVKVAYKAVNDLAPNTTNNINAMNAFVGTIIDFCDEGVVIDRANFYYNNYLNEKFNQGDDYTIDKYIAYVKLNDTYDYESYDARQYQQHIVASNISTFYEKEDKATAKFSFDISYTDKDVNAVSDKVKILILACDLESRETVEVDGKIQGKYFAGTTSTIIDLGTAGAPVSNLSKSRILLTSVVLGVVVSLLVVWIITLCDRSIKDKDELENITGVDTLSCISK